MTLQNFDADNDVLEALFAPYAKGVGAPGKPLCECGTPRAPEEMFCTNPKCNVVYVRRMEATSLLSEGKD